MRYEGERDICGRRGKRANGKKGKKEKKEKKEKRGQRESDFFVAPQNLRK